MRRAWRGSAADTVEEVAVREPTGRGLPTAVTQAWDSTPLHKVWSSQFNGGRRGLYLTNPARPVFVDVTKMKEKVRRNLYCKPYDVFDFYRTAGVYQHIARSECFERLTLAVIFVNAAWIWIDTDCNDAPVLAEAHPVFQIAEQAFCLYFALELFVRFMAFERKRSCLSDSWFVFDSMLVSIMVLETWVMTTLFLFLGSTNKTVSPNTIILRVGRLLRLARMARTTRLLRSLPELVIMIKGMVSAMRSVFFTLCLLFIFLYVFGIAFVQLTADMEVGDIFFGTVLSSMYSLLIDGIFLDSVGSMARAITEESPICAALFWVFVLLTGLTVMNMLIGVVCDVVSAVAATEKEALLVNFVKMRLHEVLNKLGREDQEAISRDEFIGILENREAANLLKETGVDVVQLVDCVDEIFQEEPILNFADFMDTILQLRGTNTATVKDIVDFRKCVRTATLDTDERLHRIEHMLYNLCDQQCSRGDHLKSTWPPPPPGPRGSGGSATTATGGHASRIAREPQPLTRPAESVQEFQARARALEAHLQARVSDLESLLADAVASMPGGGGPSVPCPGSGRPRLPSEEAPLRGLRRRVGSDCQEGPQIPREVDDLGAAGASVGSGARWEACSPAHESALRKHAQTLSKSPAGVCSGELEELHSQILRLAETVLGLRVLQGVSEGQRSGYLFPA